MDLTEITPDAIRLRPSHEGRNVLVTGAARGIGLAIARAFVERSATVGICDLNVADVERACAELNAPVPNNPATPAAMIQACLRILSIKRLPAKCRNGISL